jgi:excisionase family DNA binding protein
MPKTICNSHGATLTAPEQLLYSVKDAARMLAISECTVRSLAAGGELGSTRVGDRLLFSRPQLDRFISRCRA